MEIKKVINTVKGIRTRYATTDPVKELAGIKKLIEKNGEVSLVIEAIKEVEPTIALYVSNLLVPTVEGKTIATNGQVYKLNISKGTCKRAYAALTDLKDLEVEEMSMVIYQKYLRDHFLGEDAPIKKGKLYFKGYRVSCSTTNGFMVEDTHRKYRVVETPFEGIPTPKELGEFFERPQVEHTDEEIVAATKLGKQLQEKREAKEEAIVVEVIEVDFEKLRKKVISKIQAIRSKKVVGFDPLTFIDMIPSKQWKRKVNSLLKQWAAKSIRYPKFLNLLEETTVEQNFVIEKPAVKTSFVGTLLPEFKQVGVLKDNLIEVDGKLIEAVPFLLDYILHYEPKAMQQIMRFTKGEVDALTLIQDPFYKDGTIEWNKKAVPSIALNAKILTMVCASIGLVAPQDLVYDESLKVGDKLFMLIEGVWKTMNVTTIDDGICINKGVGLLKTDKWLLLPNKEDK